MVCYSGPSLEDRKVLERIQKNKLLYLTEELTTLLGSNLDKPLVLHHNLNKYHLKFLREMFPQATWQYYDLLQQGLTEQYAGRNNVILFVDSDSLSQKLVQRLNPEVAVITDAKGRKSIYRKNEQGLLELDQVLDSSPVKAKALTAAIEAYLNKTKLAKPREYFVSRIAEFQATANIA